MSGKETKQTEQLKAIRLDVLTILIEGIRQGYHEAMEADIAKEGDASQLAEAAKIVTTCIDNALNTIVENAEKYAHPFVVINQEQKG